jgi:hypothetical protein
VNCKHNPPCPTADAADHDSARVVSCHPEQGWSLLCNGVIVFEDTGELLPDGSTVKPHRGSALHILAAAAPAV